MFPLFVQRNDQSGKPATAPVSGEAPSLDAHAPNPHRLVEENRFAGVPSYQVAGKLDGDSGVVGAQGAREFHDGSCPDEANPDRPRISECITEKIGRRVSGEGDGIGRSRGSAMDDARSPVLRQFVIRSRPGRDQDEAVSGAIRLGRPRSLVIVAQGLAGAIRRSRSASPVRHRSRAGR